MTYTTPRIVVAPDSFKGTCSATDAATAIATGLRSALGTEIDIVECPLADGGEGTLDALAAALGAQVRTVATVDAIGRPRSARIAVSADGATGVIEAAEANGLPHVGDVALRPLDADSFGVGLLMRALLDEGVEHVLMCIGGTASSDGGTGVLSALGARFLDTAGADVPRGARGLSQIASIDLTSLHPRAHRARLSVALDVDNPLLGTDGAAAVFGPQKGAGPEDVECIDAGLATLAAVLQTCTGVDVAAIPGAGAAGGMPACLAALLDTVLTPGSDMVMTAVGFDRLCQGADLIVTGEGSFDAQSMRGKVVDGVTRYAPAGCPVVVIAGRVALSPQQCRDAGVTAALSIARGPGTLNDMSCNTADLIQESAAHIGALYRTFTRVTGTATARIAS